jgi:hypothetical protein
LEQLALMTAAKPSAKINLMYPQPVVALFAADVGQAGGVMVGAVVIHMVCSSRSEVSALLALGTPLFNGDCVAAPLGAA